MLQRAAIDNKTKSKMLVGTVIGFLVISIPISLNSFFDGHGLHIGIHIGAIILGIFLTTVSLLTYKQFRTGRLLLVMCAFLSVVVAEIAAFSTYVFSYMQPTPSFDSLITHSLILAMLGFFAVGIFRRD